MLDSFSVFLAGVSSFFEARDHWESILYALGCHFGSMGSLAPLLMGALGQRLRTAEAPKGESFRPEVVFCVALFPSVYLDR